MQPLPWVEPLVPPTLYIAVAWGWAASTGHESPNAVAAWAAVAWPLLAAICLVTIAPLLWLLQRRLPAPAGHQAALWLLGYALALTASIAQLKFAGWGMQGLVPWALALASAISLLQARRAKQEAVQVVHGRGEA